MGCGLASSRGDTDFGLNTFITAGEVLACASLSGNVKCLICFFYFYSTELRFALNYL